MSTADESGSGAAGNGRGGESDGTNGAAIQGVPEDPASAVGTSNGNGGAVNAQWSDSGSEKSDDSDSSDNSDDSDEEIMGEEQSSRSVSKAKGVPGPNTYASVALPQHVLAIRSGASQACRVAVVVRDKYIFADRIDVEWIATEETNDTKLKRGMHTYRHELAVPEGSPGSVSIEFSDEEWTHQANTSLPSVESSDSGAETESPHRGAQQSAEARSMKRPPQSGSVLDSLTGWISDIVERAKPDEKSAAGSPAMPGDTAAAVAEEKSAAVEPAATAGAEDGPIPTLQRRESSISGSACTRVQYSAIAHVMYKDKEVLRGRSKINVAESESGGKSLFRNRRIPLRFAGGNVVLSAHIHQRTFRPVTYELMRVVAITIDGQVYKSSCSVLRDEAVYVKRSPGDADHTEARIALPSDLQATTKVAKYFSVGYELVVRVAGPVASMASSPEVRVCGIEVSMI